MEKAIGWEFTHAIIDFKVNSPFTRPRNITIPTNRALVNLPPSRLLHRNQLPFPRQFLGRHLVRGQPDRLCPAVFGNPLYGSWI
jgi:hypothetical protein